ncbi:hypothetical protein ACFFOL_11010 [Halobaculum roseum]|uniref:Uncharacterized protein n=2 Tax=Halobaculum roseum TaxID=2175149 RepID=A0ABD5MLH9_9EURY
MEKLQYPADREFEKIIDDYLSREAIIEHHKRRAGLLMCNHSTSTIADASRRIFYGYDSFKFFQREALESDTTTKSSAFRWHSESSQREVLSDLREQKRKATAHGEKKVHVRDVSEDGDDLEVNLEFTVEKRGKLQGLARRRKSTKFTVKNFDSDGTSTVLHEYDKVNQQTAITEFLDGWNEQREAAGKEPVSTDPVSLTELGIRNRVAYVRDLMTMETENWTRKNVEGVQVQRDETVGEDEEDEDLDAELDGIRNAALSGNNLDNNEFVQKCEKNGFYLSQVEVRYEHKDVARRVVVEIDFKTSRRVTFEVSITETKLQSESGWIKSDFSATRRRDIREEFREQVLNRYDEYLSGETTLALE